jgi:hypothetical protein
MPSGVKISGRSAKQWNIITNIDKIDSTVCIPEEIAYRLYFSIYLSPDEFEVNNTLI